MLTNILVALRDDQVEALIAYHQHEAAHAGTVPARADHLRDADDLQRRLTQANERNEFELTT